MKRGALRIVVTWGHEVPWQAETAQVVGDVAKGHSDVKDDLEADDRLRVGAALRQRREGCISPLL